ncbi:hypothetical protein LTR87_017661 [Friedmanniomyces endolithicus]|nr:hypothetical protein LTR87_017661 [Friedmanniomyces endolithicus]
MTRNSSSNEGGIVPRPVSNPSSDHTYRSKPKVRYRTSIDDTWMPSPSIVNATDFSFVHCSTPGCNNSSAFSQYNSMTLRAGFNTCALHTTTDAIETKTNNTFMSENTVFIFYDIEVTSTMEIEQLSACAVSGQHFTAAIRTSVRRNNSPILNKFTPMIYMTVATEPRVAFENFIVWVNRMMNDHSNGTACASDVVLIAHNGMCHDHVILFRTMMMWGITPPKWRVSDSLPIFKLVMRPKKEQSSRLSQLVYEYAPWYMHIQHDALSDANALRHVVMSAIPNWQLACYVFSSSFEYFCTSVGLNTYRVRDPLPFPAAHSLLPEVLVVMMVYSSETIVLKNITMSFPSVDMDPSLMACPTSIMFALVNGLIILITASIDSKVGPSLLVSEASVLSP